MPLLEDESLCIIYAFVCDFMMMYLGGGGGGGGGGRGEGGMCVRIWILPRYKYFDLASLYILRNCQMLIS